MTDRNAGEKTRRREPAGRGSRPTSHRLDDPIASRLAFLAGPKSKIQFNGVGGLRTHISLRASQSVFPEEQGDDRGSHGTMCLFQHEHVPGSRSRRGSLALRGF